MRQLTVENGKEKKNKKQINCCRREHVPCVHVRVAAQLELQAGVTESLVYAYVDTCEYVKCTAAQAK